MFYGLYGEVIQDYFFKQYCCYSVTNRIELFKKLSVFCMSNIDFYYKLRILILYL